MTILAGKKGLIMGVANNRSIAWGINFNLFAGWAKSKPKKRPPPFTLGFDFAQSLFLVSTSLNRLIESQFDTLSPTPEKKFALRKFFKRFRFAEVATVTPFVGGLSCFIGITHNRTISFVFVTLRWLTYVVYLPLEVQSSWWITRVRQVKRQQRNHWFTKTRSARRQ